MVCSIFIEITVGFQSTESEVLISEVAGSVEVCVTTLSGILGQDLEINLATMSGEFRVKWSRRPLWERYT